MKSNIMLFILGVLLCTFANANSEPIVLTKSNHVLFSGEVNDSSVAQAQLQLSLLAIGNPNSVVYLVLDTPGGSVPAGNRFVDYANSLPLNIKPICLFCASMGYHMFQSFGERLVYSSSELMSHRVSIGGLSGQVPGEAVSRLNDIIATSNQMDQSVAKRVGIDLKTYQALIYDELWLSGTEAVKTNHADRIAKIRCSKELIKGTSKKTYNTIFGSVDVTTSNCPLIDGFLDVELSAKSKFRNKKEAIKEVRKVKRTAMWSF